MEATIGKSLSTKATRLLSAACYLSPTYRVSLYETFVRNRFKAIAPDFGLDLSTVIRHCCHARQRAFVRNLSASAVFFVLAYAFATDRLSVPVFLIASGAMLLIDFVYRWSTFLFICKHFSRDGADPSFLPPLRRDLAHLSEPPGNLVVYSGFSPFIGSGTTMNSWSVVVDITKGAKRPDDSRDYPRTFVAPELYGAATAAVLSAGPPGLTVEDKLYVNGQDVRLDARFFDAEKGRPRTNVDAAVLATFVGDCGASPIRHYRSFRIVDWSGDLVVSFFIRISLSATTLYFEANSSLLTPVDDLNRNLEHVHPNPTVLQFLIRLLGSFLTALPYLVWGPINLLVRLIRPVVDAIVNLVEEWVVSERPVFDFGATRSARELASTSASYRRHSIRQDSQMLARTLETTVLESIIGFLDAHRIDTSSLKERETAILNSGIIISGGTISAGNLAIGKGAKSIMRRVTAKAKSMRPAA